MAINMHYTSFSQSMLMDYTNTKTQTQTQTLPDATPPIVKIHLFSKTAVTFEPIMPFVILKVLQHFNWKSYLQPVGPGGAV